MRADETAGVRLAAAGRGRLFGAAGSPVAAATAAACEHVGRNAQKRPETAAAAILAAVMQRRWRCSGDGGGGGSVWAAMLAAAAAAAQPKRCQAGSGHLFGPVFGRVASSL